MKHKQRLNSFLTDVLGLQIRNVQWSFDATADDGTVVMKLWAEERESLANGSERIQVWKPVDASEIVRGGRERANNIERLKAGGETYALVRGVSGYREPDPFTYENDRLYKLGKVEVDARGHEFAIVERVVTIEEFLNRSQRKITASELITLLASLAGPVVITKNKHPDAKANYRDRPHYPGDKLDGYWVGAPTTVAPGRGFALHIVERDNIVWLGDYLGTEKDVDSGRCSLIIGSAQEFRVEDMDLDNPSQRLLRNAFRQPGPVTYSYITPQHWIAVDDAAANSNDITPTGPTFSMSQVKVRLQQQSFKNAVFKRYGGKCAVTGCIVKSLLEAAHLRGKSWQAGDNSAADGVLLRVDIHRAYDTNLLDLDDQNKIRSLHHTLVPDYTQYLGK